MLSQYNFSTKKYSLFFVYPLHSITKSTFQIVEYVRSNVARLRHTFVFAYFQEFSVSMTVYSFSHFIVTQCRFTIKAFLCCLATKGWYPSVTWFSRGWDWVFDKANKLMIKIMLEAKWVCWSLFGFFSSLLIVCIYKYMYSQDSLTLLKIIDLQF